MKNPEMLEALSALAIEKGISEEIAIADVTQARTVFEWGPQPRHRSESKHSKNQTRTRAKGKS